MNNNNELLQKLHQINLDKQAHLVPENIRKGVTTLGVTGTLEEVHIVNQDKTVEPKVTSQDVVPDEGFTGLGKVTVEGVTNDIDNNISPENIRKDVSILGVTGNLEEVIINNQDKSVQPSTSEQTVTADDGYTGLGAVSVGAVTSAIDANILPENIKKNVPILGVIGTLEQSSGGGGGDVMLFASEEEMNATTGDEGALGVIYANSSANFTSTTEAQIITFPNNVVLPSAYTNSVYSMFRSTGSGYFDGQVELSSTRFRFDGWGETGSVYITYTSTDGITYTRTDGGDEVVDIGTTIKCAYADEWDDAMGYFMQVASVNFGGLFQSTSVPDMTQVYFPLKESAVGTWDTNVNSVYADKDKLFSLLEKFCTENTITSSQSINIYQDVNNVIKLLVCPEIDYNGISTYCDLEGDTTGAIGTYLGIGYNYNRDNTTAASVTIPIYTLDLENQTYTSAGQSGTTVVHYTGLGWDYRLYKLTSLSEKTCVLEVELEYDGDDVGHPTGELILQANGDGASGYSVYNRYYLSWEPAPTQLNATALDLLPKKSAYSSAGVVEGTEETYKNLDPNMILKHVLNVTDPDNETKKTYISDAEKLIGADTYLQLLGLNVTDTAPADKKLGTIAFRNTATTTLPFSVTLSYPACRQIGNDVYLVAYSMASFAHVRIVDGQPQIILSKTISSTNSQRNCYSTEYYSNYIYAFYTEWTSSSSTNYPRLMKIPVTGTSQGTAYTGTSSSTYNVATSVGVIPQNNVAYFINTSGAVYKWTYTSNSYARVYSGETFSTGKMIGQDCADYIFLPSSTKIHLIKKSDLSEVTFDVTWGNSSFNFARCFEDSNYIYCMYRKTIVKIDKATMTIVGTNTYAENRYAGSAIYSGAIKILDNGKILYFGYNGWGTSSVPRLHQLDPETLEIADLGGLGYSATAFNMEANSFDCWAFDGVLTSSKTIYRYYSPVVDVCDYLNADVAVMLINGYLYIPNKGMDFLNNA